MEKEKMVSEKMGKERMDKNDTREKVGKMRTNKKR